MDLLLKKKKKKKNSQLAMIYMWYGKSLTGGNVNQTLLTLPNGITFNYEVFTPCEILDGSWTPCGNTGYITMHNNTVDIRCKKYNISRCRNSKCDCSCIIH